MSQLQVRWAIMNLCYLQLMLKNNKSIVRNNNTMPVEKCIALYFVFKYIRAVQNVPYTSSYIQLKKCCAN